MVLVGGDSERGYPPDVTTKERHDRDRRNQAISPDRWLWAGDRLAGEITQIISASDAEASKLVITDAERGAIKEQVMARSAPSEEINADVFLSELAAQELLYATNPQGFVGLSRLSILILDRKDIPSSVPVK